MTDVPDDRLLLAMYRDMVLLRVFDERCLMYHRQGRMGPAPRVYGHEALQVGAFHALRADDWIFPSYRETALGALRGMPLRTSFAQWRGHPAGWWDPAEHNFASASIAVGTQVAHAAGFAWAQRLRGQDAATLVFFGDGATSEGAFHEGVNFAAVFDAPLVLLCSNNGWAISTPFAHQTRAERIADKAKGYGIPGVRVDGTDPIAMYQATAAALRRARAGDGPTLLEAVTERLVPHGTADDDTLYRDVDAVAARRGDECLARFEAVLVARGLLDAARVGDVREAAVATVKAAMAEAEALPAPDAAAVFDTTWSDAPPALAGQRAAALGTAGAA
jgi:pyruvate dehydrogenase E1 component alpha subunit